MMKMVMAVIPRDHANQVLDCLVDAGHSATFSESRGGMLRQSQQTLFIVVDEDKLEDVLRIIRQQCRTKSKIEQKNTPAEHSLGDVPVTTDLGGAVVFIWNVERIESY
jgi:uncharacterized protein YaaQ